MQRTLDVPILGKMLIYSRLTKHDKKRTPAVAILV